jgi:peptide/nickel transport system permease protein
MARYLTKQALLSLIKLLVFLTIMFFFIQIVMPGDYVDQYALSYDAERREAIRAQFRLDLPLWQQYLLWLRRFVTLDFGNDVFGFGEPIADILKEVIPPTLLVFFTGTALAFLIGLWLGKRTAWQGSRFVSGAVTLGGLVLFTSFPPWLAWLMVYFFARGTGYVITGSISGLRLRGFQGLDDIVWKDAQISPSAIMLRVFLTLVIVTALFWLINVLLRRFAKRHLPGIAVLFLIAVSTVGVWHLLRMEAMAFDVLRIAWLPTLTYTLLAFGETMLIMQSSMTDVLKEEYINTAHAKGLSASTVREKHAARNALLPVLSRLVISLPYLLAGIVIIENSLGWPGMGSRMWNALYWQNMPAVMDMLMIVGVLTLVARLFLDVLSAYLDPRIRYDVGGLAQA